MDGAVAEITLAGEHIRLEPLALAHAEGLLQAASTDSSLYQWTTVPQTAEAVARYIATAQEWRLAGTALAFATIRQADDAVLGSTRLWNLERWKWPSGHARANRDAVDVCEIGHTWLTRDAIRTPANTEAKLLMLTHAFETWHCVSVCFHTDARNTRSAAALERIGAQRDGLLRAHRLAADNTVRDSLRFSIVAAQWPQVKRGLIERLGKK
jgi:RimJ/RimL family protein N-acetyltransferase